MHTDSRAQGREAIEALISGSLINASGEPTSAIVAAGPPCAGKTQFAREALMAGLGAFGDDAAIMTVSNRKTADRHADEIIRMLGASSQARPVTTMSALAFRIISAVHEREGELLPKLLNGAEQDALIRRVMAVHVHHASTGDECATCRLLREYFALDDWSSMIADPVVSPGGIVLSRIDKPGEVSLGPRGMRGRKDASATSDAQVYSTVSVRATTESLFMRGINDAFVVQLRDMLARMDELGASYARESEILDRLGPWNPHTERLRVQWRLAFALRREYASMIRTTYQGQIRLDSSRLLVEGTEVVPMALQGELPRYVVVDDFQDLTLAGLAFLRSLSNRGTRLVLVGDPDEAVQTFRGSYPEYLYLKVLEPPFSAYAMQLRLLHGRQTESDGYGRPASDSAPDYRSLAASRVSLSILSPEDDVAALTRRAWKLPRYLCSLPITPLPDADNPLLHDGSVRTALYRSANEELDDVVWQLKQARLSRGRQWNDLALIAHDNVTVRAFGERLRHDGVPVRYSSVTRPLKDEPFVQGLFALIELASLRRRLLNEKTGQAAPQPHTCGVDGFAFGPNGSGMPRLGELAAYVRARVAALMDSPLIFSGSQKQGEGLPARLAPVESAMNALGSLRGVLGEGDAAKEGETSETSELAMTEEQRGTASALAELERSWRLLRAGLRASRNPHKGHDVHVDDHVFMAQTAGGGAMELGVDALYVMLASDGFERLTADDIAGMIRSVIGREPSADAFVHLWDLVADVADGLPALPSSEPQYVLWLAWDSCKVAERWQREALNNTESGRAANDRLDAAMRLFEYAAGSGANLDIVGFFEQVRSMHIEADSLAKVAPIDQAVTVSTPAGAGGQHWPEVWIVAMQEGVWPNLAARNTMFGGEELAQVMLRGRLEDDQQIALSGHDPQLAAVLCGEQKSFLAALTRGQEQVAVSAVANDDLSPSDFLYGYLPELFDRRIQSDPATRVYREVGGAGSFAGLDADPRGLVASARALLSRHALEQVGNALQTRNCDDLVPHSRDVCLTADNALSGTMTFPNNAGQCDDGMQSESGARTPAVPHVGQTLHDVQSEDAADALALLSCSGVASANPDNWAYPQPQGGPPPDNANGSDNVREISGDALPAVMRLGDQHEKSGKEGEEGLAQRSVVSLSPSAVDGLWACPVCWLLENRFAGPQRGSEATAFGTLIHAVAQRASENGLDRSDYLSQLDRDARIAAVAERMMTIYRELRNDPQANDDPASRYDAMRKDDGAEDALETIARYFVDSNSLEYLGGNAGKISVGTLIDVACERSFAAVVSLDDILEAYNATAQPNPLSRRDLYGIMGTLVGGWPDAMREDLSVKLSGRIDREETRQLPDGNTVVRLVDYKTGGVPGTVQQFSDLQLVCYQLALAFPAHGPGGVESLADMPYIAQSDLFYVANGKMPAESYAPEGLFQPPLFVEGHLNDTAFAPRYHYADLGKLTDVVPLDANVVPDQVNESAWRQFAALRGTQAVWALTMIARVFYAAAASCSTTLLAHPSASHVKHCRMRGTCPACSGSSDTVFEIRKG